jgi:hypothetical protein
MLIHRQKNWPPCTRWRCLGFSYRIIDFLANMRWEIGFPNKRTMLAGKSCLIFSRVLSLRVPKHRPDFQKQCEVSPNIQWPIELTSQFSYFGWSCHKKVGLALSKFPLLTKRNEACEFRSIFTTVATKHGPRRLSSRLVQKLNDRNGWETEHNIPWDDE